MAKRMNSRAPESSEERSAALDQAERDLIARELERNMLVEAAAGTGKTTSLVARMINLIREGRCTVDTLAAVTFTRKAAAELRGRFQLGLERAAKEASGSEQRRLAEAVAHVERAFVGTIHSFCARLLRERPVEAGVDPEFVELEEEKDAELRRGAWLEHVARLIADGDPLVAQLENLGIDIAPLKSTFERFADYPDVSEWPADEMALPNPAPLVAAIANYVERVQSLAKELPDDAGNDKLIPLYRQFPRRVRQADFSRPAELYRVPRAILEVAAGGGAEELARRQASGVGRTGSLESVRSRVCRSLRRSIARPVTA